ncbi:4-amino-4-deoxy-L-arabinose-phosphoundecaprenol flippase subunit ArnF [Pseudomonas sp. S75]|uniref:4-amino-4-deoxy-L-arabinose-phosphoundecaprenol flippase subunit ArnF n=1 Tax=unclassified Pseudomonas TaxID=196821 RepID=UPI0019056C9B|nr:MULTISPECIES: 4-amino-4-deoxy-L-arabinose-phosphoundecaprenol flippase subunit ArnF [unclassified Pseudomonas]MBJ9975033.1 4-amino-4-deoxy-L-arabinose-phosphoundecaprenol flippase subunit ArnF [Pseudomonas sp. S30]MBK0152870.1 4-amino-4-deoxy-L-arabinose-phosphoundecaprenol flippase subunit ArnF [Pseudomonas sp. S75]
MTLHKGLFDACLSVVLVSLAQLGMHWGMARLPHPGHWTQDPWPATAVACVALAILAYLISMGFWLRALRHLPLSRAYGLLSLSYALVYLLSASLPFFDTRFSPSSLLAVGLIVAGIWLMNTCAGHLECGAPSSKESS